MTNKNALKINPDGTTTAIDWPAPDPTRMVCPMYGHLGNCDDIASAPLGTVNGHPLHMFMGARSPDRTPNVLASALLASVGIDAAVHGPAVLTSAAGNRMAPLTDDDLAAILDNL